MENEPDQLVQAMLALLARNRGPSVFILTIALLILYALCRVIVLSIRFLLEGMRNIR